MPFKQFIYMIVNGISLSVMCVGLIAIIVSLFTMNLGTTFFGLVLTTGSAIILSISIKLYERIDDEWYKIFYE